MPGFQSKIVNFLMRNRHFLQGKLKRDVFDMETSIDAFRDLCERGGGRVKIAKGVEIRKENIRGINAEWIIPEDADQNKVILYVHGGGYVSGSCSDHRGFVSKFADRCGYNNLVFEYRLAPEHTYPAAVDDSVRVYKWLLKKGYKSENILIAGESAGGGLTLALLLALKERKISLPKAAVAISPWTDLTCSGESYKTKGNVSVAPADSWIVFSKHYVGNNSANLPLISPLFGDLAGLPALFINSAVDDELFDDGRLFAEKAEKAGIDITFREGIGMVHCYPLLAPMFKEATDALNEICEFIKMHLK